MEINGLQGYGCILNDQGYGCILNEQVPCSAASCATNKLPHCMRLKQSVNDLIVKRIKLNRSKCLDQEGALNQVEELNPI